LKVETNACSSTEASWHADYRDTAYVYIGGLPYDLSEGDIVTIFSQFGEPVWIKLSRDKETGKSKGFAWLKYEDQRSTDLAVDNLGGATIMGRIMRVDHTRYKRREDEDMTDNTRAAIESNDDDEYENKRAKRRRTDEIEDTPRPVLPEEHELVKLLNGLDPEDPMNDYLVKEKKEEVAKAIQKWEKEYGKKSKDRERRHRRRSRDRSRTPDRHGHRSSKREKERHRSSRHARSPDSSRRHYRDKSPTDPPRKNRRDRSRTPVYNNNLEARGERLETPEK
jgi:RNA-binding motif X-linked protein 2